MIQIQEYMSVHKTNLTMMKTSKSDGKPHLFYHLQMNRS